MRPRMPNNKLILSNMLISLSGSSMNVQVKFLEKMNQTSSDLSSVANHAQGVLRKVEDNGSASYRAIWEREQKVDRFKARLPLLAGGLAVLFVVGLLVLPRFIAAYPSGCAVLGGLWTATTTGVPICVQDANDGWIW